MNGLAGNVKVCPLCCDCVHCVVAHCFLLVLIISLVLLLLLPLLSSSSPQSYSVLLSTTFLSISLLHNAIFRFLLNCVLTNSLRF